MPSLEEVQSGVSLAGSLISGVEVTDLVKKHSHMRHQEDDGGYLTAR